MIARSWKQVIYFKPEGEQAKSSPPAPPGESVVVSLAHTTHVMSEGLLDGAHVIEDERGVRLARETDD